MAHWVFSGMKIGSGKSFLVEVGHHDAATLLPIISNHIWPGSVIYMYIHVGRGW